MIEIWLIRNRVTIHNVIYMYWIKILAIIVKEPMRRMDIVN